MKINIKIEYGIPKIPINNIAVQCPLCNKWFRGADITENKLDNSTDVNYANFECPTCSYEFSNFRVKSSINIKEDKFPGIYENCFEIC